MDYGENPNKTNLDSTGMETRGRELEDFWTWLRSTRPGDDVLVAAEKVNGAFLFANRALDTVKESVLVEHGLPFASEMLHNLAHAYLQRLDDFGNILHEKYLLQTYPATPRLDEPIESMDKAYAIAVEIVRRVDEALGRFIQAADSMGRGFGAMARKTENIQMQNSADRTLLLQAWQMWDNSRSKTSFDSWVRRLIQPAASGVNADD